MCKKQLRERGDPPSISAGWGQETGQLTTQHQTTPSLETLSLSHPLSPPPPQQLAAADVAVALPLSQSPPQLLRATTLQLLGQLRQKWRRISY